MNLLKKIFTTALLVSSLAFGQGTIEPRLLKRNNAAVGGSLVWDGLKWNSQVATQYVSTTFNFSTTKNSGVTGDLSVAGNNILSFSACPMGVNGSSTSHYVYVSGGTGTAEAALIAGGSCLPGLSGTLIISTANTHTGTWTIASATAGIQEALNQSANSGMNIIIPPGIHTVNAPIKVTLTGARILGSTRNNVTSMLLRTSGVLFDVSAGTVEIAHLSIRGGAQSDGTPAPSGNIGIQSNDGQGHFHDLNIDRVYDGIKTTAGSHTKITNIWGRNVSHALIHHAGGVSPFIDTVTYGTDSPYEVPEAGILINASGAYIYNTDILTTRHGILIEPSGADLEWTFIYDARIDQAFHSGVTIRNNSAYELRGVFIHDLWSASTGLGFAAALLSNGLPLSTDDGVGFTTEGSGAIRQVVVDGGQIHNSRYQNAKIQKGTDVKLFNVRFLEANIGDGADIDNIYVSSDGKVEIVECEIRDGGGTVDMRSGILAAPVAVNLTITNNTFDGTFSIGSPVHDLSTNGGVRVYGTNRGMDEVSQAIASSGTLAIPARQYFEITGTTTVSTMIPTYQGRKLYLYKSDAGTLDFDTNGNIQSPTGTPGTVFSLGQGQNAICEFSGNSTDGRWLCHK